MSWLDDRLDAIEREGADASQWNELGRALAEEHRLADAERCFRRAVELGGRLANYNLANVLRERGMTSGDAGVMRAAVAAYREALEHGCPDAHVPLGLVLLELGEREQAREQLLIGIELGDGWAGMGLAQLASMDGDRAEQERQLRELFDDPNDLVADCARAELGIVLRYASRPDEAEQVLRGGPGTGINTGMQLARLLDEDHNDQLAAEAAYRDVIALGHVKALRDLGRMLHRMRRLADAAATLRQAIAAGDLQSHAWLARVLRSMGDRDGAMAEFEAGMRAGDATGFFEAAEVAELEDRRADQERILWRAMAELVEPGDCAQARIQTADLLTDTGRLPAAVELLRAGVAIGEPSAVSALGIMMVERFDDRAGAEALYREAAARGDDLAQYDLAMLLWKTDRPAEAEHELLAIVEAGGTDVYRDLAKLAAEQGRASDAERYRALIPRGRR